MTVLPVSGMDIRDREPVANVASAPPPNDPVLPIVDHDPVMTWAARFPIAARPLAATPVEVEVRLRVLPLAEACTLVSLPLPFTALARLVKVSAAVPPSCTLVPLLAPVVNVYVVFPMLTVLPAATLEVKVRDPVAPVLHTA